MNQQELIDSLPRHLRQFVTVQDYDRYTPRDHAVWRYIMHRLVERLRETAHPVYLEGLEKTGISQEHVPSIEEMNAALSKIGWAAVVVDGFIPPAIFMEFQARQILVIAVDMRSYEHILYTPAPDIVHESAGHAPFIVDIDYSEFLQRFGEVGMKAIATRQDHEVYLAIRHLSIVKEDPDSGPEDIEAAEKALQEKIAQLGEPSEAALLARLHWWTVEYGLVGELDDYRIFGAGLLSSLGESVNCLDDTRVKKLPLTVDAVATDYDITTEQPQLFVTKSCKHMSQVLEEFAGRMCQSRGGAESLQLAVDSESVCTAEYSSGLQVSGHYTQVHTDAVGNAIYLQTTGPTQLAFEHRQLSGHGIEAHADGFGSPIGKLKELPRCPSEYTVDELKDAGIEMRRDVVLEFLSGITVRGHLDHIVRQEHRNLLLSFSNCRVTNLQGEVLFEPEWGTYDMAVGASIPSVFGGAADREHFDLYRHEADDRPPAAEEKPQPPVMALYRHVRELREAGRADDAELRRLYRELAELEPEDWLLRLELLELTEDASLRDELSVELKQLQRLSAEHERLIGYGLSALEAA